MKIYMMRHGETGWNERGKLQGQTDIPLNENGIRMAKESAEGMKDIPFDVIYSSPLKRAYKTAQIVRGDRDIPIIRDDRLMEMKFGIRDGIQMDKFFHDPKYIRMQRFMADPEHYRAPKGGESFPQLYARSKEFFDEVIRPLEGKADNVLLSAHGALVRSLIASLNQRPISQQWKTPFGVNCCVACFDLTDGKVTMDFESKVYYETEKTVWSNSLVK